MEAAVTPAAPAITDFRARIHQVIDQIQDPEMLRVVWQLLAPQVSAPAVEEAEPELSPEQLAGLDESMRQLDAGQGIPFAEVMARLQAEQAA